VGMKVAHGIAANHDGVSVCPTPPCRRHSSAHSKSHDNEHAQ
jgi:hypothetical protein